MKTFGNDLKYFVINGDEDFNEILESLNPLKIINDFLSGQVYRNALFKLFKNEKPFA